jgi:hypothetical protein
MIRIKLFIILTSIKIDKRNVIKNILMSLKKKKLMILKLNLKLLKKIQVVKKLLV